MPGGWGGGVRQVLVQGGGVLPGRARGTDESGGRTGSVDKAELTTGALAGLRTLRPLRCGSGHGLSREAPPSARADLLQTVLTSRSVSWERQG